MLAGVIKHELPLILFTVCSPAAAGASWCAAMLGFTDSQAAFPTLLVCLALTLVGMLASIVHLAKPLRAPRSISNWKHSWLSREILIVSGFALAVAIGVLSYWMGWGNVALFALAAAAVIGALLLFAIAAAYRVHGQPGWDGPEGLWEVAAIAIAVAFSFAGALSGALGCVIAYGFTRKSSADRRTRLNALDASPRVTEARKFMKATATARRAYLWFWVAAALVNAAAYLLGKIEIAFIGLGLVLVAAFVMRACFYALASTARFVPPAR